MVELETVSLAGTKITGAGLAHLKGFSRLRTLNVKRCDVADEDLARLEELKNLRMLYVKGCKVTKQGADSLKKKIPGLAVFFY